MQNDRESKAEQTAESYFSRRLALLSEVTNELSTAKSPDELHRRVVELGRGKLDLDRLALHFISRDKKSMKGSFGTGVEGELTDERETRFPIEPQYRIWRIVTGEERLLRFDDVPLYLNGSEVGRGTRVIAGLWDGEHVIGFMSVDNLLKKRGFTGRDEEFIRLYAFAVGHLCTLKAAEEERRNLQAQLLQAQKMESVGRLAGGVAHDFNNMLGVIIGLTELTLGKLEADHPLRDDLEKIGSAARRSADLTSQLLAFARKQITIPKAVDLNAAVPELLNMLGRLIGNDIGIDFQPGFNLWPVLLDPVQLDQVLAHLCNNARDAITGQGRISIKTANVALDETFCEPFDGCVPGDYVLLAVNDDGCGMSDSVQSRLFEPFFTTKELGRGSGLGLATVYGIVRQNNGIIQVESSPGRGTTFLIHLPRLIALENSPGKDDRPVKKPVAGRETILLVEDEPALLDLNRRFLERQGYTVLCAESPEEGLRIAGQPGEKIDLLVTDVVMPGMNGRDLARKICTLRPGIKRLFMSGYASDIIAVGAEPDEGLEFIQKPFSLKNLAARVREILSRK